MFRDLDACFLRVFASALWSSSNQEGSEAFVRVLGVGLVGNEDPSGLGIVSKELYESIPPLPLSVGYPKP